MQQYKNAFTNDSCSTTSSNAIRPTDDELSLTVFCAIFAPKLLEVYKHTQNVTDYAVKRK